MDRFYTSGQFADFCGVNKATLIYYNEIGLLKPHHVGKNGYFYYSYNQVYQMEIITSMKMMDLSISEIRDYLNNQNVEECIRVLKHHQKILQEKRIKMEQMEALISDVIHGAQKALATELDIIEIKEEKALYLYTFRLTNRDERFNNFLNEIRPAIEFCKKNFYAQDMNVGEIVLRRNVENGSFLKSYGFYILKKASEDENVKVKPAGTYITVSTKTSSDKIPEVYQLLKEKAEEWGYEVCGNAYEEDLLNFLTEHDRSTYIIKCSIQVRKI